MNMKNVLSSLFALLFLTACENRAEAVDEEINVQKHEQFQKGEIATHSKE